MAFSSTDADDDSAAAERLRPGMIVVDRDQDVQEQNEAVVIGLPPSRGRRVAGL